MAIELINIVDIYWIEDSIERGKALPEGKYFLLDEGDGDKKRSFDDANSGREASDETGPQAKRAREKETAKSNVMEESTEEVMEGIEKAVKSEQLIELDLGWISESLFLISPYY